MDIQEKISLPEEDYLKIFEIIRHLYHCQTKPELRECIQKQLLDWLQVDYAAWGWIDMDLQASTLIGKQLMDCAGIPESEFSAIQDILPYHKHLFDFAEKSIRTVNAVDVDFTRKLVAEQVDSFFQDHPELDREQMKLGKLISAIGLLDRPSFTVGFGLNRIFPNTKPFTRRDIRRMELIQPTLVHTIKRIAIQDQLQTHKALTAALEESHAPFALMQEDGRVLFRNISFYAVVPAEPGDIIPKGLRDLLEQQVALLNPDRPPEIAMPPMAFYQSGDALYRLNLTQLHPKESQPDPVWLLRLQRADDSYTMLHRKLQQSGLTPREVEVALLAGDRLDDTDIVQRLFISPNTLKNHLKSIYQKLDVHSRVQLTNRLLGIIKGEVEQ